jgi:hypothetical protein
MMKTPALSAAQLTSKCGGNAIALSTIALKSVKYNRIVSNMIGLTVQLPKHYTTSTPRKFATNVLIICAQTYLIAITPLPAVIALKQNREKSLGRNRM